MAVAFDASSFFEVGGSPQTFLHTPVGVPRGVLMFSMVLADIAGIGSVRYGGVVVPLLTEARDVGFGRARAFFLGAGIPAGPRIVELESIGGAGARDFYCISMTANRDVEVLGPPVLVQETGTLVEQNMDTGVRQARRFAGCIVGDGQPFEGSNSTPPQGHHLMDFGTGASATVYETVPGAGSRPVGFDMVDSVERAAIHLAIGEVSGIAIGRSNLRW